MAHHRHSNQEDRAVEALIVAGMLSDPSAQQELDSAGGRAELSHADRVQLDSMPPDFVQRILDGGWVGHIVMRPDDSTVGGECICDRVPS